MDTSRNQSLSPTLAPSRKSKGDRRTLTDLALGAWKKESVKSRAGGPQIDAALQRDRSNPDLLAHVDSFCRILAAGLPLADHASADQLLTQFLSRWNEQREPN